MSYFIINFVQIKRYDMGKKLKATTEKVYVDMATGEEIATDTSKTFIERVESTEHFFMTYIDFIAP